MGGLVVTSSAWDWYQSSIAAHLAHKYQLSASQVKTNLPYFGVKLSCVCLMFAYRKKVMTIVILW